MAETTGSATDLEDLLQKFLTWAVAQGWTQDEAIGTVSSGRQLALHKGACYVQMRWNPTVSATSVVAIYQSTGYTGGNRSGTHPGDSGNGYNTNTTVTDTTLDDERCLHAIGNGPFPSYYFYTNATGDYLHCVAETATDTFIHWGMGDTAAFEKFGDWGTATGGAYCYGHQHRDSTAANLASNYTLFDGGASTVSGTTSGLLRWATMRLTGMPGQAGSEVWATIGGNATDTAFTQAADTAGNARAVCIGGFRGGLAARAFGNFPAGNTSGLAPLTPIGCTYLQRTTTPRRLFFLGWMKDVRAVDLTYMAPKDTFTLGADTWRVFPVVRRVEGSAAGDTDMLGIAYKT
jgi:hypothetical protein